MRKLIRKVCRRVTVTRSTIPIVDAKDDIGVEQEIGLGRELFVAHDVLLKDLPAFLDPRAAQQTISGGASVFQLGVSHRLRTASSWCEAGSNSRRPQSDISMWLLAKNELLLLVVAASTASADGDKVAAAVMAVGEACFVGVAGTTASDVLPVDSVLLASSEVVPLLDLLVLSRCGPT